MNVEIFKSRLTCEISSLALASIAVEMLGQSVTSISYFRLSSTLFAAGASTPRDLELKEKCKYRVV